MGRLEEYSRKAGVERGWVKDLRGGEVVEVGRLKKVYIS